MHFTVYTLLTMISSMLVLCSFLTVSTALSNHWRSVQTKNDQDISLENGTSQNTNESYCPLWTRPKTDSDGCYCGNGLHDVVQCEDQSLKTSLLACFCMSYSEIANKTVVGYCIFTCKHIGNYIKIEANGIHELNDDVCNSHKNFSRTGQMCGKCKEGYAPPVYSYSLACVECSDYQYNWLKYIAIAFLPATVFYIMVVMFRVSVTSPAMIAYVLVNQVISIPTQFHLIGIIYKKSRPIDNIAFMALSAVYGIWNLDFLRGVFEPFCLHPKVSFLQILLLEYLLAVYPMLLVIITYLFVCLQDNSKIIRWCYQPFYKCFVRIRREWNIQSSLISAFATFILLSYVKILDVTFQILTPTRLYDVNGDQLPQLFLYYNGTVEYFGKEHLPYAVLALFMFTVFNVFPLLLLCLYPCQCFQRCLNCCNIRWPSLHIFMDTFHGCYKLKPYDCRYFAAFYVALRIINYGVLVLSTSVLYYSVMTVLFAISATVTALARPYRKYLFYTIVDAMNLLFLTLTAASITTDLVRKTMDPIPISGRSTLLPILVWIQPLFGLSLLVYSVIPKRILAKGKSVFMNFCQRYLYHCFKSNAYAGDHVDWFDSEPVLEYCSEGGETDDSSSPLILVSNHSE